jgi:hypothetical protein
MRIQASGTRVSCALPRAHQVLDASVIWPSIVEAVDPLGDREFDFADELVQLLERRVG